MTMRYRAYAYTTEGDRRQRLEADVRRGLTASPKTLPSKYFYDAIGSKLFEDITRVPEYYLTPTKTRLLLDARDGLRDPVRYVTVDVDEPTVEAGAARLLADYPFLDVHAVVGDFERHLDHVPTPAGRRLVLFLGSTIGNLDPP